MLYGYMGKMLFVDLTRGKIEEQELSPELARNFIGGYGLGARGLYDLIKPGIDPLGPENVLGFVTGPATGSGAFFGSRFGLVCKSPVNGCWCDSNSGGYFGAELKKAGFDAVFFTGISPQPVYLWVKDGKAELRDARQLWGKDTRETLEILKAELGDPLIRASIIGQAGERLALFSCPINDGHRALGRGGGGAVMGSKKLKAIVARGNLEVPLANPEKVKAINRRIAELMRSGPLKEPLRWFGTYGTGGTTPGSALDGNSPVKNWGGVGLRDFGEEAANKIGSTAFDKYKVKKYACRNCPLGCGAEYEVKSERWQVGKTDRPEYETSASFGTLLLNSDGESILMANEICSRYGLDTISAGATIGWAMECYDRGLLTRDDLDGIELSWGNSEAVIAILKKIANVEGCGAILAKGSEAAANYWGKGHEYLITIKGMELPLHDPKFAPGFVRTYQFDPTPGRHVKGGLGHMQEVGDLKDKYNYYNTGYLDVENTVNVEVLTAAGFCLMMDFPCPEGARNEYIEAITGWPFNAQQCYITGMRILNMRHAFNLREGFKPSDFVVPARVVGSPPHQEGPLAGIKVDHERLARNFFHFACWDYETGKQSLESLRGIGGLEHVIRDLYGEEASCASR